MSYFAQPTVGRDQLMLIPTTLENAIPDNHEVRLLDEILRTQDWSSWEGRIRKPVKLFAGAHDLRRSFCSRWARKVMPAILQKLARHAHIYTTMGYYVCLTADDIGSDLWAKHGATADKPQGNILGNIGPERADTQGQKIGSKSLPGKR